MHEAETCEFHNHIFTREYNKRLDRRRPCFEDKLAEGSNLQYKVTNQFDAGDKLYL